tara:strand:- start:3355 stop:3912 length:558 start_codon:yes stop_codon:yes gene_type:complete
MKKTLTLAALTLGLALAGCGNTGNVEDDPVDSTAEAGENRLFATVEQIDDLSTAHDLIEKAGLQTTFVGVGAYTLFLPHDDAFANVPEEELERLISEEGRPKLIALLRRHIAVGAITRADLDRALEINSGSIQLASVADTPIDVRAADGEVTLGRGDDAPQLTGQAKAASNGVVYVIDGLIPPDS